MTTPKPKDKIRTLMDLDSLNLEPRRPPKLQRSSKHEPERKGLEVPWCGGAGVPAYWIRFRTKNGLVSKEFRVSSNAVSFVSSCTDQMDHRTRTRDLPIEESLTSGPGLPPSARMPFSRSDVAQSRNRTGRDGSPSRASSQNEVTSWLRRDHLHDGHRPLREEQLLRHERHHVVFDSLSSFSFSSVFASVVVSVVVIAVITHADVLILILILT